MTEEKIHVDTEPISEGAQAILEKGAALVRIENMTQMRLAIQEPRDIAKIKKEVLAELQTYPESAFDAIYEKPVGKEKVGNEWVQKYASGLSVRAAEALAYAWGNNAFAAEIVADDGTIVTGVAIYLDYEKNTRRAIPFRISRKYKAAGSSVMKLTPEDRFNDIVIPAKLSKVLREVILRSLPPGIKAEYEQRAREIIRKKEGDRWGRVLRHFSKLGVSAEDLEEKMGKDPQALSDKDFEELIGMHNAIMDGETTVAQCFGKDVAEAAADSGKTPVTMGEVLGSGGGLKEGEKPGEKETDESKQNQFWARLCEVSPNPEAADVLFEEIVELVGSKAKMLKGLRGKKLDAAIEELDRRIKE